MSFTWNLIKVFIMSHKANFNDRRAGAPKSKILLDLRNLEETEREVLCLLEIQLQGQRFCNLFLT